MARTITLSSSERRELQSYCGGSTPSWQCQRAQALLLSDAGETIATIQAHIGIGSATIKRVKARFRSGGISAALTRKYGQGRPHRLGSKENRALIALACTECPNGGRWTIRALAKETGLSRMTVQRTLAADGIKPWREKNVVRPDAQR